MPKRRIDAADTIEPAVHFLNKLASDGWGVRSIETNIDYAKPGKHAESLPTVATVTITLRPI